MSDVLRLLHVLRNHGFNTSVGGANEVLEYEPRAMAIAPDGHVLAVGTKHGDLTLLTWQGERWNRTNPELPRPGGRARAIRALSFVDDRHVLVVQGGPGLARVVDTKDGAWVDVRWDSTRDDPYGGVATTDSQREPVAFGDLLRTESLIGVGATQAAIVAVARTRSDVLRVFHRHEGQWRERHLKADTLWALEDATSVVDVVAGCVNPEDNTRLVVTEDGRVLRIMDVAEERVTLHQLAEYKPPPHARIRGVASTHAGLVLYTRTHALCCPWGGLAKKKVRSWLYTDRQQAFALWRYPSDSNEPNWLITGSDASGLTWRRADKEGMRRAAPHDRTDLGLSRVLYLVVYAARCQQGSPPPPPPYVAVATRDHMLRVRTLEDTRATEQALLHQLADVTALMDDDPAVVLFRARVTLARDFGVPTHLVVGGDTNVDLGRFAYDDEQVDALPSWRTMLDANDVRNLASFLIGPRVLGHLQEELKDLPPPEDVQQQPKVLPVEETNPFLRAISAFRLWALRLMRRSSELRDQAPDLGSEVSRKLRTGVDRYLVRRPDKTRWPQDPFLRLHHLVRWMEKWVEYGHTYENKPFGLMRLATWNLEGGRYLDALVYLLKLLRRRVDRQWNHDLSEGAPNARIWSMASAGPLAFLAHHDGRITACLSNDGTPIRWSGSLPDVVQMVDGNFALVREKTAEFRKKYYHGPYARAVWASSLGARRYLVVFPLRATDPEWRNAVDATRPRLIVLLVQHDEQGLQVIRAEDVPFNKDLADEIYSIEPLAGGHRLALGLRGVAPARNQPRPPFLALSVKVEADRLQIDWEPEPLLGEVRERSTGHHPSVQYNPSWALAAMENDLWVGTHDGLLRCFRFAGARWEEVQNHPVRALHPDGIGEPISALRAWHDGDWRCLAWGTVSGKIAVIRWCGRSTEAAFLAHERLSSEVRALVLLPGDRTDGSPEALLSITRDGACVVHLLRLVRDDRPRDRIDLPGMRVDHFRLDPDIRSAIWLEPPGNRVSSRDLDSSTLSLQEQVAAYTGGFGALLIGRHGTLERVDLVVPMRSRHRRQLFTVCEKLFDPDSPATPTFECLSSVHALVGMVGRPWVWRWLRANDNAGLELMRFSLWQELTAARGPLDIAIDKRNIADAARAFDDFRAKTLSLAEEAWRHQPWSREPAKVLWAVVGRAANYLGASVIDREPDDPWRETALGWYHELNALIESLTNQWIGADPKAEEPALMHSLAEAFDWHDILLLCSARVSTAQEAADSIHRRVRSQLLRSLVQPRLLHQNPVVATEALRVLNDALLRALFHRDRVSTRQLAGHANFMDLVTLVAEVPSRHRGVIGLDDPLITEVCRFLAGTLLLVPNSGSAMGLVISEAGLARGEGSPILKQVQAQVALTQELLSTWRDVKVSAKLEPLKSYLEAFDKPDVGAAGSFLHARTSTESYYHDDDIGAERALVDGARVAMRTLEPIDDDVPDPAASPIQEFLKREPVLGKRQEDVRDGRPSHPNQIRYFAHTHALFKNLSRIRNELRTGLRDNVSEEELRKKLNDARTEIRSGVGIEEPFRSWYLELVDDWERQTGDPHRYLRLQDKYNRHRYQVAAADLDAALRQLALDEALVPLRRWHEASDGTVRGILREALADNPQFLYVFDRATRLIDESLIASVMTHAVRDDVLGRVGEVGDMLKKQTTDPTELKALSGQIGSELGLNVACDVGVSLPGPRYLWAATLRELLSNVKKHASGVGKPDVQKHASGVGKPEVRLATQTKDGEVTLIVTNPEAGDRDALEGVCRNIRSPSPRSFGLAMVRRLVLYLGGAVEPAIDDSDKPRISVRVTVPKVVS